MSEKHQKLWKRLNERQQKTLKAIYDADQWVERREKRERAQGDYDRPPAAVWRWLIYGTFPLDSELKANMRQADLIDEGTGSTWAALERRGLIETQQHAEGTVFEGELAPNSPQWYVFIKLTNLGRAVARAGDPNYEPQRSLSGVLSEAYWSALVTLHESGVTGIPFNRDLWNSTWQAMSQYKHENKRYPLVEWKSTSIYITAQGRKYYSKSWQAYRDLYPHIDAPQPSPPTPPSPARILGKALRAKRDELDIGYRELSQELEISPTDLVRIENYQPVRPEIIEKVKDWLQI